MANRFENITEEELLTVEFIYNNILNTTNEADRNEAISQASIMAKKFKCKGDFQKILKSCQKEEREERERQAMSNKFKFSGCSDSLITGLWQATDKGIVAYTDRGVLEACSHPIYPVCLLNNVQTGKEKVKLAWTKGKNKAKRWKEITVDKSIVASHMKIVKLADDGIAVTTETSKALVKYLADVEKFNELEILTSTSKLGWINGRFIPFEDGMIIDSEDRFEDILKAIHKEGSREKWFELVSEIRSSGRYEPRICMAAALASVLIEPLNELPFILNLWGESGKGKTVTLILATSIFADPEGGYKFDSSATKTAFEVRNDFLNNLPGMIDDLSQVKEKYKEDFSDLIYMLCAGNGKGRSDVNLGVRKPAKWKCSFITNNEHSIIRERMQGGAINRVIDVEIADGYVFQNANQTVETLRSNYGFLGEEFIKKITELGFDTVKKIQKSYISKIKKKAKGENVLKEEKQMSSMSLILTADKILEEYFFKDGILLDFDQCYDLLKDQNAVNDNQRTYEEIINKVGQNINSFIRKDNSTPSTGDEGSISNARTILGIVDFAENVAIIEKSTFDAWCVEANNTSNTFLKWAKKRDLLKDHDLNRNVKKTRLGHNGMPMWCVHLVMPEEEKKKESDDGFMNAEDYPDKDQLPIK